MSVGVLKMWNWKMQELYVWKAVGKILQIVLFLR